MERVVENKLIRDPYPNRTLSARKNNALRKEALPSERLLSG